MLIAAGHEVEGGGVDMQREGERGSGRIHLGQGIPRQLELVSGSLGGLLACGPPEPLFPLKGWVVIWRTNPRQGVARRAA